MDCTSAENEVHIEGQDQQQQQQQHQQEQQKQQLLQQQQITLDFTISSYYSSVILPTTGERSLKIAISDTCIM